MEDLSDFAKFQLKPAQEIIRSGGELTPMLIADGPEGCMLISIPQYGEPKIKPHAQDMMREFLRDKGAERYAFVMEAWVGTKKAMPPSGYLPSKDPEREEAIIVSAADNSGACVVVFSKIQRQGDKITFSEPESLPIFGGPLLELLKKPTAH